MEAGDASFRAAHQALQQSAVARRGEARALPEEECSNLVNRDLEEMTEEEFAAELKRRWDEYQRDPSVGIPWSEVKRQG